jgi:hypothetical protein
MIEQNAAGRVKAVGFAIVSREIEACYFGNTVG